ncbi:MAG TPA: FAD-binding oxidoreductase [Solirubrobacteraceae bacterium]
MSAVLPPGCSASELESALEAFRGVVGSEHVLSAPAELGEFRDPFWHAEWDQYEASAVLQPESVEQIQAILAIANERRVPLWVTSQGRNNGYGGSSPRVRGSVVVNLRRMNRVLEINEELGYAVVEPGVSWFDLYQAITDGGHKLMLSCADLGWGSVIGNTLDHGCTYLPYGVDMGAQCGMEVVLPSGELMRTGMGAMPGNRTWNLYKRGLGPTPDQLFMQSNFGVVTKMGVWLMPWPETYMPFWVRAWRDEDVAAIIDTLRKLSLDGTIRMVPQVANTLIFASFMSRRSQWWDGEGPIPDPVIEKIARELETGRWMMRAALYGDEAVVDHRFAKVKAAFEAIPGVEVWGTKTTPDQAPTLGHPAERTQAGVPDLDMNFMTGWYGGEVSGGHVGFSPVAPMTGRDAIAVRDLMRGLIEGKANLDYLGAMLPINARSFIHVTMVLFDTANETQVRGAYDTCKLLVKEAAQHGYGEYRAHIDFMDLAVDQYSFGDHAQRRFNERIKDALDPNGILAPGKSGIWPASMRPAP